ncbi:helix-turn-helix domain-containing protein [Candidatus Poriferisodalis sp.]|uniref:helix-turn-helix domain-containing protein n=1 Tax=Candidatus Poriferisodalis sp. TaxID=3101277 RepID=UPI003D0ACC74
MYVISGDINVRKRVTKTDEPGSDEDAEMALARRLRFAREHIGLVQADVATALDIPRASVSAIESGKRRVSSLELRRLGRLYRRPVAWLLGEEGTELDADAPLLQVTRVLSDHDKEQVLRFAEFLADAGRPGSAPAERVE